MIEEIVIAVAEEENGKETVCIGVIEGQEYPLIGLYPRDINILKAFAKGLIKGQSDTIRLLKFSHREELEVIQ